MNKYRNIRSAKGMSKKEALRGEQLQELEAQGIITDLRSQVRYELIPARRRTDGYLERAAFYVADYVYTRDGKTVVEDVKPTFKSKSSERAYKATEAYRMFSIKRKLMLYRYGIEVQEV